MLLYIHASLLQDGLNYNLKKHVIILKLLTLSGPKGVSITMEGTIWAPVFNFDLKVTFYGAKRNNLLLFESKVHKRFFCDIPPIQKNTGIY